MWQKKDPVEYNNTIINEQAKVVDLVVDFNAKVDAENYPEARVLLGKSSIQCDSSIKALEALGDYDGDAAFKDAAVNLFKFYKRASEQDYKQVVDIAEKGEDITEEDYDNLTNILQKLKTDEDALHDVMQKAQTDFAGKHNVKIMENADDKSGAIQ
ncbi:MAG: hypothetical protein M0D57_18395 [Sphingobacteriales bacterium JAD_PAG50586_3]|nr:MAG: hypothetical protein M0D57_18395 [Sphingobacteriales bacterium JAD_PAG50586_3]